MFDINHIENIGFRCVAAVTPKVRLANPDGNADAIMDILRDPRLRDARYIVFPELSITGYSIGDLFFQDTLLREARLALKKILDTTANDHRLIALGLPLVCQDRLYNCAAVIAGGEILGIVPKINIPNYQEFYEKRWFHSGKNIRNASISLFGREVPFGDDLIFDYDGVNVAVEICEDLWVPSPPSSTLCKAGASLILNLSATDESLGKYQYLTSLISSQSGRCRCAYVYSSAGNGESSTDLVFAGNDIIALDGSVMAKSERFADSPTIVTAWIDFEKLANDRRKFSSFFQDVPTFDCRRIKATSPAPGRDEPLALPPVNPRPFVPSDTQLLDANCREIISIQSHGLEQRLRATGCKTLVVGISGGLDSTLALLVAHHAFKSLGFDLKGIRGVTMPGNATSSRTYRNSLALMRELGVSHLEIPVKDAVTLHFRDIGHDPEVFDATYENSQARERTQILMDLSNQLGGMVLGTGDLSELALGWCTYNGDHMSMYNVNASIPKTLVKHLVGWMARRSDNKELSAVLLDILDTPISPELIPAKEGEEISQKTEDLIGPYELHDFFLYHVLRNGFGPAKIFSMARIAFSGVYDASVIKHWLLTFYRRFFSQQFKRSCMPDGPKVGSVCLSPRGDWRMPSDADASIWIEETKNLQF